MDVVARVAVFQQPRMWSGQAPPFSSRCSTNHVLPLYPDVVLRKSQTYPTFWNLFSTLSQTYLTFCTWIHRSCNDKCNRTDVIHEAKPMVERRVVPHRSPRSSHFPEHIPVIPSPAVRSSNCHLINTSITHIFSKNPTKPHKQTNKQNPIAMYP